MKKLDTKIIKEIAILGHIYQLLMSEEDNLKEDNKLSRELNAIAKRLQNIIIIYKRYWEVSEVYFQKRWKGIDKDSRDRIYYTMAYIIHMLLLYKYNYGTKRAGKALFNKDTEKILIEILEDMEKNIKKDDVENAIVFAEKVYNKIME